MSRASRYRIWLPLAAITVAVLVGLPGRSTTEAHGGGDAYVDVALSLEVPDTIRGGNSHQINIIVTNHGSRAAYDVEVAVDVVVPDKSFFAPQGVPVGSVLLENEVPVGLLRQQGNGRTLRWTIPVLGGLQREELAQRVWHIGYEADGSTHIFSNVLRPHEFFGEVTTASSEDDSHKWNNTSRAWSYNYGYIHDSFIQVGGNYTLDVSVDEYHPEPGDIVNFTVTIDRPDSATPDGHPAPPIDLRVDIELTDGLTVAGEPTYVYGPSLASRTVPASFDYSDGVFRIGTLRSRDRVLNPRGPSVESRMTLPVRLAGNATASGQCLTATLTGNPPPGTGRLDDDVSDNAADLCLGMPGGPVLLTKGQSDLLTLFPCVGEIAYPCGLSDTVELAVNGAAEAGIRYGALQSEDVVVQIEDPAGRIISGGAALWRTGNDVDHTPGGVGVLPGVAVKLAIPIAADGYSQHTLAIADPGRYPGNVRWFLAVNNFTVLDTGSGALSFGPSNLPSPKYGTVFEFSALGTYHADMTFGATHSSTVYADTSTYTFHVGPVSNLGVSAATTTATTRNQVAFTVTATNAGPEHAPDARARVTLPDGLEFVRADREDFDPAAGVWRIGELRHTDYRQALGQPEGETLTIVAELTGETAGPVTGSIQNHADYCVRIKSGGTPDDDLPCGDGAVPAGYTQHAGPYLDHRPGDNTFSLAPDWRALVRENPPYLTSLTIVSAPTPQTDGPGAYLSGDVIALEARFNKTVYATGSPTLRLRVGDEDRAAGLVGGSGTDVLRFEYTVDRWDRDTDGVSVPANPFRVSGHPIRDGDGNDAMLDFAGLPDDPGHRVDQIGQAQQRPEPGATAGLTATAGDGYVDLRWRAAANSEQVFYQLWRDDDPTWWDIAPREMGADRGYTVTGLANGSAYVFRVRAHARPEHGGSPGSPSAPVAAVPRSSGRANNPPEIDRDSAWNPPTPHCVAAGQSSGEVARVSARDPDGDPVTFYLMDGPWENFSHHFTVDNTGSGDERVGIIRVARAIPRGLNLDSVDVDLEANDGRGGVDQVGLSLRYAASGNCRETNSRSDASEENWTSVLAAVETWAGNVRNLPRWRTVGHPHPQVVSAQLFHHLEFDLFVGGPLAAAAQLRPDDDGVSRLVHRRRGSAGDCPSPPTPIHCERRPVRQRFGQGLIDPTALAVR